MQVGKKLKQLVVERKTGYRNITGNPVILLDERGIPFYDTRAVDSKVWEFNLPPGTYFIVSGKFTEKEKPVDYPLNRLPAKMRDRPDPEHFELVFSDNPFTGTIAWNEKMIVLDSKLSNEPIPTLVFILKHEYGHRYYSTKSTDPKKREYVEKCCDLFARNEMIKEGYNPSQIIEGSASTLDDNNINRIMNVMQSCVEPNTDNYTAADFVGSSLKAKKKISVYKYPEGPVLYTLEKGANVGTIETYVVRDGFVWWNLVNGNWVKHDSSGFDADTAVKTSYPVQQAEIKAEMERRLREEDPFTPVKDLVSGATDVVSGAGKSLSMIGDNLPLILVALIAGIIFIKTSK